MDADDALTPDSLAVRLDVFQKDENIDFVDGRVEFMDTHSNTISGGFYQPSFDGKPYEQLLKLNSACFFGPTWMIKRDKTLNYTFDPSFTHSEDIYFFLTISKGKIYSYTKQAILNYRKTSSSAMANLDGLEHGYINLLKKCRTELKVKPVQLMELKLRTAKIMFLSYLFNGKKVFKAIISPFKMLLA